jgi:hypothetical protein
MIKSHKIKIQEPKWIIEKYIMSSIVFCEYVNNAGSTINTPVVLVFFF